MKKNLLGLLFVLSAVFAVPVAVGAQDGFPGNAPVTTQSSGSANFDSCSTIKTNGVRGIVNCIMAFFNSAIYLLIAAGVVYVVYGAFKMISSEEGREDGKKTVYYGIIGLFVMVSIWGLVNILQGTFNLAGQGPLPAPTFNQSR